MLRKELRMNTFFPVVSKTPSRSQWNGNEASSRRRNDVKQTPRNSPNKALLPTTAENLPIDGHAEGLKHTLRTWFGYDTFKTGQLEAVAAVLAGKIFYIYPGSDAMNLEGRFCFG